MDKFTESMNTEILRHDNGDPLDLEHLGASGISAQLVPEFSRKLSFVEHDDDDVSKPGNLLGDTVLSHVSDNTIPTALGNKTETMSTAPSLGEPSAPEIKHCFVCQCGDSFEKSVQLAAHKRWTCKLSEKTAQCDVCRNWFASEMGLRRHMKHAHGGMHSCDSCSLRFPNKIKLTRHWIEAHYREHEELGRMLKCFECGDTNFDNKQELECHLVLHKFEKHQQKLGQTAPTPHHPDIHFSPYPSPPFMRGMRPPHPFHQMHGFGPRWSHFPFRPPPPMFPFMPYASFVPFRPPFLSSPRAYHFAAGLHPYPERDDGYSFKSSTADGASSKVADEDSTSTVGSTGIPAHNPHHNHEYVEPTAFPCFFHPPYDYKHRLNRHKHLHHHAKRKWKKYLKLMMKGGVPPLVAGLATPQGVTISHVHLAPAHDNQEKDNTDQTIDEDICEFKMACKFCEKVIEKNQVLWHQKKECPVLAAHRCTVCDRVFKKRHFLLRHIHEQNHQCSGGPGTSQTGQSGSNLAPFDSLPEAVSSSLQQLNFSEDVAEPDTSVSQGTSQRQARLSRNVLDSSPATTQLSPGRETSGANVDKGSRITNHSLRKNQEAAHNRQLQCAICRHVCQSTENLTEHLREHINQVLAIQKVREWTSKSSEYFFLDNPDDDDDDELEGSGSVSTATTSYFDSEITSTTSSALPDQAGNFSSLETTTSKDSTWAKPHKKWSRYRHKGETNICEFCREKFSFRKDLHYHMETSHRDSTLECPVCRKKFSWKKRGKFYERHLNSHYGVKIFKHKCGACGKTFLENSKLRAHMSLHNSELLHKCSVCEKGYANKSSLVRHERKHTGVRPYQCSVCPESFMEKRELLRHSTTHTGLAPFNCGECGQGFTLKTSLMSHIRKRHSKKDKPLPSS